MTQIITKIITKIIKKKAKKIEIYIQKTRKIMIQFLN